MWKIQLQIPTDQLPVVKSPWAKHTWNTMLLQKWVKTILYHTVCTVYFPETSCTSLECMCYTARRLVRNTPRCSGSWLTRCCYSVLVN
jgi:hypothetical protein